MNPANRLPIVVVMVLAIALLAPGLPGCAAESDRVISMANRQTAALNADDIVRVMQRTGFSDQQIIDLGTDLRNALATAGAAKIRVDGNVEAIFAVDGRCLHASVRLHGGFIYDLETGKFR